MKKETEETEPTHGGARFFPLKNFYEVRRLYFQNDELQMRIVYAMLYNNILISFRITSSGRIINILKVKGL